MDRLPPGVRGRAGKLFGEPYLVPEGPLRLASLTGAPIVTVLSRRVRYMEYEVVLGSPIRLPRRPFAPRPQDATPRSGFRTVSGDAPP